MKLHFLPLLLVLAVASVASAKHLHDCVCKVACPPFGGSGTLVGISKDGKRGIVLSAWHVVEEGNRDRLTCTWPLDRTRPCRARIIGKDVRYDIVALEVADPPKIQTPKIVAARKEDAPFTALGFPWNGGGRLRWTRGPYVGYPRGGESAWAPSMLHTRQTVISGYSGGCRLNRYGQMVAVVSGMTGDGSDSLDRTWGVGGPALIKFTRRYMREVKK